MSKISVYLCALCLICAPSNGLAQSSQSVNIGVRVLKATHIMSEERGSKLSFVTNSRHIAVDERISDLSPKLKKLDYTSYRLLSSNNLSVPLTRREVIALGAGETLTVRPLYADGNKVAMWLKWQDRQGQTILDTRMHFVPGESFVTGTDNSKESGIILAIDVKASQ